MTWGLDCVVNGWSIPLQCLRQICVSCWKSGIMNCRGTAGFLSSQILGASPGFLEDCCSMQWPCFICFRGTVATCQMVGKKVATIFFPTFLGLKIFGNGTCCEKTQADGRHFVSESHGISKFSCPLPCRLHYCVLTTSESLRHLLSPFHQCLFLSLRQIVRHPGEVKLFSDKDVRERSAKHLAN